MGNLSRRVSEIELALQKIQVSVLNNMDSGPITQKVNAVEAFAKKTRSDITGMEADLKKSVSDMTVEINANRSRFDMLKTSSATMDARLKAVESRPVTSTPSSPTNTKDLEDIKEHMARIEAMVIDNYNELKQDLDKKSDKRTPKKK